MRDLMTSLAAGASHHASILALRGLAACIAFCFHLNYVALIPIPKAWSLISSQSGLGVELFYENSA
jgi:hypothetical protein